MKNKALGAICVCILCGILVAGLWPFHAPQNEVSWLSNGNGLLFGDYGSIVSSAEFSSKSSEDKTPCSLEIWLEPGLSFDSNDIVAFSTQQNPVQFAVAQSGEDLFVKRDILDARHQMRTAHIAVDHVFRQGRSLFITITSGTQGTAVYIDGALVKLSRQFGLTSADFSGHLVVANSPIQNNSWAGRLRGLGIYNEELAPEEVSNHYHSWVNNKPHELASTERTLAVYFFNEHIGRVAHNQVASQPNLYIPEHYFVLHPQLLVPPWKEFEPNSSYCQNVVLNIGAFVPLGFFFCAYLSHARRINRRAIAATVAGFTVSVTIEVLQAFLPTRESGMTDIITNTLGTAVGAMLFGVRAVQDVLATVGIPARPKN